MKAKELIEMLSKNPEAEIGKARFDVFDLERNEKHKILSDLVMMFGRFERKILGREIYMAHDDEKIDVRIWDYDRCEFVGKILVKKLVQKPFQPQEMMMIEETTEQMVTDCELKEGKYEGMEILPL